MSEWELVRLADAARANAYAPYSGFTVGAALLCADGRVFCGSNVENASYPVTCCAERSALFAAVSTGERVFAAIAVMGGHNGKLPDGFCTPCGLCRQALAEFCAQDFPVLVSDGTEVRRYTLEDLLPASFSASSMARGEASE